MTATAHQGAADAPIAPPSKPVRARGRLIVVCVLLAAAVGLLLYKGLLSSLDYFDTVDQALNHRAQVGVNDIRLEGLVVKGTVQPTTVGTTFSISGSDGRRVTVINKGTPPQLFQPDIPVVVVGRFSSMTSTVFDSNQIMVKHSANYTAAHKNRVTAPNGSVR